MTAEQVRAALDAALRTQVELNPADPYQMVLDEFVGYLNEQPWLRAEVRPAGGGKAPGAIRLVIWPRYQRSLATNLHLLLIQGNGARVLGDGSVFGSPEELDQFLVASLQSPSVAETLREFRRMASEDVEGYLRVKALRALTVNDVSVIVPHADQVKLADAAEAGGGAELEVLVELLRPPPLGRYQADADYRFLKAGGYAMTISEKTEMVDEKTVKVHGTVMSANDTPHSEE